MKLFTAYLLGIIIPLLPLSYPSFFQRDINNIVFIEPYLGQYMNGDLRQNGMGHELVNALT